MIDLYRLVAKLRSEKGYVGMDLFVGLAVCFAAIAAIVGLDNEMSDTKDRLAISEAKVVLLEQGFTEPRKAKDKNMFTVGFGPVCKLTLDWDGKSAFSFSRFRAPGLKYPIPARDIPVMKNATYDRISNLREMRICGAEPQNN